MEQLTETFRRLVEESEATPAQWALWHLRQMAEAVGDLVTREELEHALRARPELLSEAQAGLDAVGAVVADAALAARNKPSVEQVIAETRAAIQSRPYGDCTPEARHFLEELDRSREQHEAQRE